MDEEQRGWSEFFCDLVNRLGWKVLSEITLMNFVGNFKCIDQIPPLENFQDWEGHFLSERIANASSACWLSTMISDKSDPDYPDVFKGLTFLRDIILLVQSRRELENPQALQNFWRKVSSQFMDDLDQMIDAMAKWLPPEN